MTEQQLPITTADADDWPEISRLIAAAFHEAHDPTAREGDHVVFEPDRSLLVRDGGTVVAHASAYTRELTVPGAVLPAAHVTQVAVAPTHRRNRLLTRLMTRQLREVRDAGTEYLAVLWASEGRIYPRFGYGQAAQRLTMEADLRELRLPEPPASVGGRLRTGEPAALADELARVYEDVRVNRPGWSSRADRHWRARLTDPSALRFGATERRAVLHEGPGGVDGYALWRTHSEWDRSGPRGTTRVEEVVADTPAAYLALWRLLFTIDLTRRLSYPFAAVDEPLLRLVDEPRRLDAQLVDALWLRLVNVPAALAARRYAAPVDVVIEVTDPLLPENAGRWRLTGGPDGARCVPADEPAELACDVRDLGELYLGGTALSALVAAGRVRELRPGAARSATTGFGWYRAPVGIEVF
ncbi:GNAT family N-acetyltransferase [Micromonospora sp. CPCC 206060]|uniref:GNAT family N-acetyltransferase n=1 Tax=Micromonospora sp. CPCC 206060 TaxID=3122406 RepID=UPI002FF1CA86